MRKYQTLWFCMNLPLHLEQRCAVTSGRTKFEAYISRRGGRNMAFFDELGKVISDKSKGSCEPGKGHYRRITAEIEVVRRER